jgi:hypothetical protein
MGLFLTEPLRRPPCSLLSITLVTRNMQAKLFGRRERDFLHERNAPMQRAVFSETIIPTAILLLALRFSKRSSMSRNVVAAAYLRLVILMAGLFAVSLQSKSLLADESKAVSHRIMVCEYSDKAHRLVEIDGDGKVAWEHKFPAIAVCFRMTGDSKVVFADGGSPTGIVEVDRKNKTTFDYRANCEQVLTCDVLSNGNFLVAEQGPCQAVEVNAKGEVVSTVKLSTTEKAAHRQLRCLHRLANGHLLACHEAEGVVREYDAEGKPVWEYPNVTNVFEALRLSNGNTLIGCGTDKRVIEVTPEKKVVWELTAADKPELNLAWITSLQVLKNGNVVVANFLRGQEGKGAHAFEITRDEKKTVVWKYDAHDVVRSITMVRVLDNE